MTFGLGEDDKLLREGMREFCKCWRAICGKIYALQVHRGRAHDATENT